MPQFQAGYFIEELEPFLLRGADQLQSATVQQVRDLLLELSWFDVQGYKLYRPADAPAESRHEQIWQVAVNLLTRGLPTRAPLPLAAAVLTEYWPQATHFLTDTDAPDLSRLDKEERGTLGFILPTPADTAAWEALLWRALHTLEPALGNDLRAQVANWKTDSRAEKNFAAFYAPKYAAAPYLTQLLHCQTRLPRLLQWSPQEDRYLARQAAVEGSDFLDQEADFTLAFPYHWTPPAKQRPAGSLHFWPERVSGLVLEVDGPHHKEPSQQLKDKSRDRAAIAAGWFPVRVPVEHLEQPAECLAPLREVVAAHPYFARLRENYEQPLADTMAGRQALQLTLGPFAVARVQRVLLEALLGGAITANRLKTSAEDDKPAPLRIAVVERDVACAQQGVAVFLRQLRQLYALHGQLLVAPEIELHVFPSAGFDQPARLPHPGTKVMELGISPHTDDCYDLLLDVSMLQRPGLSVPVELPGVPCLSIRTAHMAHTPRRFRSAPFIRYPELVTYDPAADTYRATPEQTARGAALEELVQDVFRKRSLRSGQLPIISRALQGESVLGLLPTGGGKSLTFQLAVLLQPGVCLVVAPIKSLMQDQYEGLRRNWIDAVTYINSSVPGRPRKQHRMAQLRRGEVLFMFVSPERLVMDEFRTELNQMASAQRRVGFSYCVIDEAHCVSEWGHDFRTPYLRLGVNARRFCQTYDGTDLPLFGLTATASFDVLADVQRELHLDNDESAVVRTASLARPELHIRVLPVAPDSIDRDTIARAKYERLEQLLSEIPHELLTLDGKPALVVQVKVEGQQEPQPVMPQPLPPFQPEAFFAPNDTDGKLPHAGLVFCPHKAGGLGVTPLYDALKEWHHDDTQLQVGYFMGSDDSSQQQLMAQMQTDFVESNLNLLVATKAFGMGIDKAGIRFTVHVAYPSSIESFVQEAGRAGRDRAVALSYILYNPADRWVPEFFFQNSFRALEAEACIMHELLTTITFPSAECVALNVALQEEFPDWPVTAKLYTPKGEKAPISIYLNGEENSSYGHVRITKPENLKGDITSPNRATDTVKPLQPAASADISWQIVNFTVSYLLNLPAEARATRESLLSALGAGYIPESTPGIMPRLQAMREGQQQAGTLVVGYSNGMLHQMSMAAAGYGLSLSEGELAAAISPEGSLAFIGKVRSILQNKLLDLPVDLANQLAEYFPFIRLEKDTFRAIHRLCLLGVVEDYTIEYSAKTVTLHLAAPQDAGQLQATYQEYLARYTTPEKASQQAAAAQEGPELLPLGQEPLEKFIAALLLFNETETKAKRKESIEAMATACELGFPKQKENGEIKAAENLSEYFDLYLNSKYARTRFLPDDTDKGKAFNQDIIWTYLNYMRNPPVGGGKERDNIKHLRGACARLLTASPKNGAFLLLGAFSTLYLELTKPTSQRVASLVEAAQQHLIEGFRQYSEQGIMALPELVSFVRDFAREVGSFHRPIGDYVTSNIEEPLQLELHTRWLTEFTDRFCDLPATQQPA